MTCKKCIGNMSAYIDMQLSADDEKSMLSHLEDCEECMLEYNMQKKIINLLGSIESVAPPPHFTSTLMEKLSQSTNAPLAWYRDKRMYTVIAGLAACIMIVVGPVYHTYRQYDQIEQSAPMAPSQTPSAHLPQQGQSEPVSPASSAQPSQKNGQTEHKQTEAASQDIRLDTAIEHSPLPNKVAATDVFETSQQREEVALGSDVQRSDPTISITAENDQMNEETSTKVSIEGMIPAQVIEPQEKADSPAITAPEEEASGASENDQMPLMKSAPPVSSPQADKTLGASAGIAAAKGVQTEKNKTMAYLTGSRSAFEQYLKDKTIGFTTQTIAGYVVYSFTQDNYQKALGFGATSSLVPGQAIYSSVAPLLEGGFYIIAP